MAGAKNEAKIKFTADTHEFNKAIQSSNSYLKQLRSELQLNATALKNGGDQTELLKERFYLLSESFEAASTKVENMRGKVEAAINDFGEGSNEVAHWRAELANAENAQEKLRQQLEACNAELVQNVSTNGRSQSAYAQLTATIDEQRQRLDGLKKGYVEASLKFGENSNQARSLANQIEKLSSELSTNQTRIEAAENKADEYDATLRETVDASELAKAAAENLSSGYSVLKNVVANLVTDGLRELKQTLKETAEAVVDSGMDYENAFAGIRKTVDVTGDTAEEVEAQFSMLSEGIKDIAEETSHTSESLAGIGEVGGQMGVELGEAAENMLGFIRTVADLQVATDIVGEEGAQNMAQFAEITGMAQEEFSNFGSSIVAVGNKFPTTENAILQMSTKLAGAASQAGMTEAQIVGLAAGLTSMGLKADAGGSSFSKVISQMVVAASTSDKLQGVLNKTGLSLRELELLSQNNSKEFKELADSLGLGSVELNRLIKSGMQLEDFGTVAGMTGKEFKKAFEEDAAGALTKFILGLENTNSLGDSATATLQEMGITELRVSDALRRAANASETFAGAINVATTAWEENTALTNEASIFYGTTSNQLQSLKNSFQNIGIELFERFSPAMKEGIDTFKGWLETQEAKDTINEIGDTLQTLSQDVLTDLPNIISNINSGMQTVPGILNSVSSAITWVTQNIDEVVTGIKLAVAAWALVKGAQVAATIVQTGASIVALTAQVVALTGVTKAQTVAQSALNVAQTATPWGAAIAGAALLVAGVVKLVQWIGDLNDNTAECNARINAVVSSITPFRDGLASLSPQIADVSTMTSSLGRTVSEVESEISTTEQNITTIIQTAINEQRALREEELIQIEQYNDRLLQLEIEKLEVYRKNQNLEIGKIIAEGNAMTQQSMQQHLVNLQTTLNQANEATEASYNARNQQTYAYYEQLGALESQEYLDSLEANRAWRDAELAQNREYYNQGHSLVLEASAKNVEADMGMWNQLYNNSKKGREAYTSNIEQMDLDNAEAFLSMYTTAKQAGVEIPAETEQMAVDILNSFQNLPDKLEEQGKATLEGLISGMEDQFPELKDTSEMTCDGIVDTIKDGLDIHSPSRVTYGIGADTIQGAIDGMASKNSTLNRTAMTITQQLVQALTPNKTATPEIGKNAMTGIGSGLQSHVNTLSNSAKSIATGMIKALTPNNESVKNIGSDIITGINSGMNNKSSWLGNKISSLASGIVQKFKDAFKIGSPSRLLADEVGEELPAGIGVGFGRNANAAIMPLRTMLDEMKSYVQGFALGNLSFDINSRFRDHMESAGSNSTEDAMFERLIGAVESIANRAINLYVGAERVATATAAANDKVTGTRIALSERGLALE